MSSSPPGNASNNRCFSVLSMVSSDSVIFVGRSCSKSLDDKVLPLLHMGWPVFEARGSLEPSKSWGAGQEKGSIHNHHCCMEKRQRFVFASYLRTMGNPKKARVILPLLNLPLLWGSPRTQGLM